jgi:hypothetical protein
VVVVTLVIQSIVQRFALLRTAAAASTARREQLQQHRRAHRDDAPQRKAKRNAHK